MKRLAQLLIGLSPLTIMATELNDNQYATANAQQTIAFSTIYTCMGLCIIGTEHSKACIHLAGHNQPGGNEGYGSLNSFEWTSSPEHEFPDTAVLKKLQALYLASRLKNEAISKIRIFGKYNIAYYPKVFAIKEDRSHHGELAVTEDEVKSSLAASFGLAKSQVLVNKFTGSTAIIDKTGALIIDE